ncbi:NOL1/NOP2/Sun domain member 3 [Kappamyces sp. JEL0680]|nr:NOL1/NOP2/Sun domain member 3 [Kappamyces sp. JEL0680]
MSKKKQKEQEKTIVAQFKDNFTAIYHERWPLLSVCLEKPKKYCHLVNSYCDQHFALECLQRDFDVSSISKSAHNDSAKTPLLAFDYLKIVALSSPLVDVFPRPEKDFNGIMNYYPLDAASLVSVQALDIQPDDRVLDVCAAPGGKSLAILQYLKTGKLTANEMSNDRRKRLRRVFDDYIPPDKIESSITICGRDATAGFEGFEERFDKVLVDAPCSSERHLMNDNAVGTWSINMSPAMAKKQAAILAQALKTVKPGGALVYSTCSISPLENDAVVKKVLSKTKRECKLVRYTWPIGEPTKLGWIILPDHQDCGWGPIYFSIIKVS